MKRHRPPRCCAREAETRRCRRCLKLQQRAVGAARLRGDRAAAESLIAAGISPAARLDIYRNTFVGDADRALRLSFPAVQRLVGADFFEGAAQRFIAQPSAAHAPT